MRHHNSVFHSVLKHVPWAAFDALVAEHGADAGVRRLTTKSQFVALLFGQLSGAASLREIEAALASHRGRLYHLGASAPRRATLADANATRPADLFAALFTRLLGQAGRGLRKSMADTTYLIDSTGMRLGPKAHWARFSTSVNGVKLHVIHDPDADRPIYAAVTTARVNDIVCARDMPVEPGATYVFDLGYYDYAWWARLDEAGCRIVTRFKANTPLDVVETLPVDEGGNILSDRIGFLPKRQMASRSNPMADCVREVRVLTQTGKELRILSNDLDARASEIADLYKRRWAIELFFRWIKQTLKIDRFLGLSENAVRIQIAVALIAFLLLRLAQAAQKCVQSPLAFARLVRANLMHKRPIDALLEDPKPDKRNTAQAEFAWT
jgi:Transposase DDE domain/Domain of unknown function (DUF4372)